MHSFSLITLLLSAASISTASPAPAVQNLTTFPTWIENIAVRQNSHLLLSSLGTSSIYSLDPTSADPAASVSKLPAIPDTNSNTGITEISPDLFIVSSGQWNLTTRRAAQGTQGYWSIDFRGQTKEPIFKKVAAIPESTALNGMTHIPGTDVVLSAESVIGAVYAVDVKKGTYKVAIKSANFAPSDEPSSLGINGVKYFDGQLYFTNSAKGLFGRVPISRSGSATGEFEILATFDATVDAGIDDFAIDEKGTSWIADHPDSLSPVNRHGQVSEVVSGTDVVPDPTSAAFGRGRGQQKVLYVTTNLIGAEGVTGGVVAIDIADC